MSDMTTARRVMVDNQIRTFDVTDRDVLAAFDVVARESFLPASEQALAYLDRRITLPTQNGHRVLLAPMILARLVQALAPRAGEGALDVMGGSGYSAAILAAMGLKVTTLEQDSGLTEQAKAGLAGIATVLPALPSLSASDKTGLPKTGFDVILVNGACEVEPDALLGLLNENGRLGIIQRNGKAARAVVYLKSNGVIGARQTFDAPAAVLPGFAQTPGFVF